MTIDHLVQQFLDDPSIVQTQAASLPDDTAAAVIDCLKREADRHWWINANRSLDLANIIIQIGHMRGNLSQEALGLMARGDALKVLGQIEEAWDILGQAGDLFQQADDLVGWARTRIGRLLISVDLNRVREALADGATARAILLQHGAQEIALRLDINTAIVYDLLGDNQQALTLYHAALDMCEALGEVGRNYLGMLYTNIGYAYNYLGDFQQALTYYQEAHQILMEREEVGGAAIAELNMAYIAQAQGHYRHALQILHRIQAILAGQYPAEHASARRVMVECYLALNRYLEARDLAQQVAAEFEALGSSYEQACTVQHLATAEAELGNLEAAQAALDRAEVIFIELGATSWLGVIHLCRGRIALRHGQIELARHEALAAADYYGDQDANRAWAVLLEAQAKLAAGDLDEAAQAGRDVLRIAQRNQIPAQRYSAYVLLGRVMEARQERQRAARAYHLAATIIEQIQRDLTLTLRPGFLEGKSEALHALIRLYLQDGRTECAFETLERAKSQVLLDYLGNRESLHWSEDDPQTRQLIDELNQLRTEHHWYYRLAHENQSSAITPEQAFREASEREQHMRAITEQLYLQKDAARRRVLPPSIHEMQSRLDESALLVEFYNDGTHVWAFILSTTAIDVIQLPVAVDALDQLIDQLQFNITCAVRVGISPAARQLAVLSRQIAQRLYQVLLHPLESIICRYQRLVVVPYGALHYLPFHLLHTGTHYLVEQCEVVVLPAAGLITHRPPQQPKGATVLAHSQDGLLPQALVEARYVHSLFSGDLYTEADGVREVLRRTPRQILHLAAHGEHRIDHPDLSYIQLADGLLYTDDLLQHDLSYELVTLSACESGRAHVDAGDELIGLGRGFLYAGAGALIVSLWRVDDASTVALMRDIYHALSNGSSKAEALRAAQCAALTRDPDLHPAFWGAFQLVGDAGPLSQG